MQINEGLKAGDLEGVIDKRFSIDQYKSKMGDDKNIMVLAFTAEGLAPAKDLERFAETGYKEILDAIFETNSEMKVWPEHIRNAKKFLYPTVKEECLKNK